MLQVIPRPRDSRTAAYSFCSKPRSGTGHLNLRFSEAISVMSLMTPNVLVCDGPLRTCAKPQGQCNFSRLATENVFRRFSVYHSTRCGVARGRFAPRHASDPPRYQITSLYPASIACSEALYESQHSELRHRNTNGLEVSPPVSFCSASANRYFSAR